MVCDYRPKKEDPYRTRLTVGGDRLECFGDSSSPVALLIETKLLLNSTISDANQGAQFSCIDLKDHFLQSDLPEAEYMRIHGKYFFDDIRTKYNIDQIIADDGYVYCRLKKGMYGLKQATRLAHDKLVQHLKPYGYKPDPLRPNLWTHKTRKTKFCLCVDDFGVKTYNHDDTNHLLSALKAAYNVTIDYSGKDYCGLTLEWNYNKGYVDISMPKFVHKTLTKLKHNPPSGPQHAPHNWVKPNYTSKPLIKYN